MRKFCRSLDRAAGEINAYLLIVALGLAVIDLLLLLANAMPPMAGYGIAQ